MNIFNFFSSSNSKEPDVMNWGLEVGNEREPISKENAELGLQVVIYYYTHIKPVHNKNSLSSLINRHKLNKFYGHFLFHGGCHSCKLPQKSGLGVCTGCRLFRFGDGLPTLSTSLQ